MTKLNILDEAQRLTTQDRQSAYGHPASDFDRASRLYAPILEADIDPRLKHALIMIEVKIARLLNTPTHIDSVIDIAGYANTYAMILDRIATPKSKLPIRWIEEKKTTDKPTKKA